MLLLLGAEEQLDHLDLLYVEEVKEVIQYLTLVEQHQ